jgi:hypothetical protein
LNEPKITLATLAAEEEHEPVHKKPRRFTQDTINDLIFWGCHLAVVALALAVVWHRIDLLTHAVDKLLVAQQREIEQSREQTKISQQQTELAKSQADIQTIRVRAADAALKGVIVQVTQIQGDVAKSLVEIRSINEAMLAANNRTAVAAQGAQNAASNAASTSIRAANESASARSIVARKVVTSEAKLQLDQQKASLAAQQKHLRKVIQNTKLRGPTVFQKIFQ